MLYLDYAKQIGNRYILNLFADSVEDINEISGGKEFITKNGTNYGVPLASSTIVITMPDRSPSVVLTSLPSTNSQLLTVPLFIPTKPDI